MTADYADPMAISCGSKSRIDQESSRVAELIACKHVQNIANQLILHSLPMQLSSGFGELIKYVVYRLLLLKIYFKNSIFSCLFEQSHLAIFL